MIPKSPINSTLNPRNLRFCARLKTMMYQVSIEDKAKTNLLAVGGDVLYSGLELALVQSMDPRMGENSELLVGSQCHLLSSRRRYVSKFGQCKWYTPSLRDEAAHKAKMRKVMASLEQNENTMDAAEY